MTYNCSQIDSEFSEMLTHVGENPVVVFSLLRNSTHGRHIVILAEAFVFIIVATDRMTLADF